MLSICLVFDAYLTRYGLIYTYLLKVLEVSPKRTNTLVLTFLVLLNESPSTRAIQEHLASLPCRDEAYPTIIQIMRQERNYFRQLKSVKHEINELYPSARHAYIAIGLAVKTGRPHNVIPAKAGISHFFIKELNLHCVLRLRSV